MKRQTYLVGTLAAGAMLVLVATGVAVAATIPCGADRCVATQKPDRITGDASDNYIVALGGADGVYAGPGDDVVAGNRGHDRPGASGDPDNVLDGDTGDDV